MSTIIIASVFFCFFLLLFFFQNVGVSIFYTNNVTTQFYFNIMMTKTIKFQTIFSLFFFWNFIDSFRFVFNFNILSNVYWLRNLKLVNFMFSFSCFLVALLVSLFSIFIHNIFLFFFILIKVLLSDFRSICWTFSIFFSYE